MARTKTEDAPVAAPELTPEEIAAQLEGAGYVELEDKPIIPWENLVGRVVEGKVHRIREGGKGFLLDLAVNGEVVTYGLPRVLQRKLEGVAEVIGKTVAIICTGKTLDTPNGKAWDFKVYTKGSPQANLPF